MTVIKGDYSISTDKDKLDVGFVHAFLSGSYWAENIPQEVVERSIRGSLTFGVYHRDKQIGFARMITDEATFAYLVDVFIDEQYRGRGLSKWLIEVIISHPGLQGLRRMMLATRDAHELYSRYGFAPITNPERWMQIHNPDIYNNFKTRP